jgi:hypothetical protein
VFSKVDVAFSLDNIKVSIASILANLYYHKCLNIIPCWFPIVLIIFYCPKIFDMENFSYDYLSSIYLVWWGLCIDIWPILFSSFFLVIYFLISSLFIFFLFIFMFSLYRLDTICYSIDYLQIDFLSIYIFFSFSLQCHLQRRCF